MGDVRARSSSAGQGSHCPRLHRPASGAGVGWRSGRVGLVERGSRGDARGSRRSRRRAWSPAGGGRRLVAGQAAASWCGPGPLAFVGQGQRVLKHTTRSPASGHGHAHAASCSIYIFPDVRQTGRRRSHAARKVRQPERLMHTHALQFLHRKEAESMRSAKPSRGAPERRRRSCPRAPPGGNKIMTHED